MKQKHLKQIIFVNQKITYGNILGEKDDGSKRKEEATETFQHVQAAISRTKGRRTA